jgi:hypothetical protein
VEPYRESKSFVLRIELEAEFGDDYEGDDDGGEWLRRWLDETRPALVAAAMRTLGTGGRYRVVSRSRGKSPEDEVELVASLRLER